MPGLSPHVFSNARLLSLANRLHYIGDPHTSSRRFSAFQYDSCHTGLRTSVSIIVRRSLDTHGCVGGGTASVGSAQMNTKVTSTVKSQFVAHSMLLLRS